MATVIVQFKVQEFKKWEGVFSPRKNVRESAGAKSEHIYQDSSDPNQVTLLFQWNSLDNARKFFGSQVLLDALKESGVLGQPMVDYLVEA